MNTIPEIDLRINVLEKELLHLRKRRNELITIRRLPAELTVRIFKLLIPPVPELDEESLKDIHDLDLLSIIFKFSQTSHDQRWKDHDLTWVNLMSTCTWYRRVALETRELWYLEGIRVPGSSEWRRLCRSRAGNMPLILKSQIGQPINENDPDTDWDTEVENALELLEKYLPEANEAFISLLPDTEGSDLSDSVVSAFYNVLGQSCKNLRYLNLSCENFTLSNEFLGGMCANMTTLVLFHISEFEMGPELPSLRHLHVQLVLWKPEIEIAGLLEWVVSLSTLEVLHIDCNAARLIFGQFDNHGGTSVINLPHLRILKLQVVVDDGATLLKMFSDPHHGLDVTLTEKPTTSPLQALDAAAAFSYQDTISRIVHFWYRSEGHPYPTTELQVTVTVTSSPTFVRNSQIQSAALLTYRSFSIGNPPDIGHRFCNFLGPQHGHVPLAPIRSVDLHLASVNIGGTWFNTSSEIMPEHMSIRAVILDITQFSTDEDTQQIQQWLTERKQSGKPILLLQMRTKDSNTYLEKLTVLVRDMVADIQKLQLVNRVEWV